MEHFQTRLGNRSKKNIFDAIWGNEILKDASKLISVSDTEVDQYLQMKIPSEKKYILSLMAWIPILFVNYLRKEHLEKKYNINENKIVLFLGRLHERKGIDFLIKAYADLIKEKK